MIPAIARLARFAATVDVATIDPAVRDAARLSLVDTIGVMLAGAGEPLAQRAAAHAAATRGEGPCRIVGGRGGIGPLGAAFANGVAAHVLDGDDTLYEGMTHPSAAILPAVLAACGLERRADGDLLAGLVAGLEVQAALGRAFSNKLYDRGVWTTGFLGGIAAAAGAARALRLDATATAHALALAAGQAAGSRRVLGSDAKPFLCGRAAEIGIDAALAARRGFTGPADMLDGPAGLAHLLNDGGFDAHGLDGLGSALARPILGFKLFPVCSSAQGPIEAIQAMRRDDGVDARAVVAIACTVTAFAASCMPVARPRTPTEARFCLAYSVACALLDGTVTPAHLDAAAIARPAIADLMSRITVAIDDAIAPPGEAAAYPEAARVAVTLADGRRLARTVLAASCMPPHRAGFEAIAAKFRGIVTPVLGVRTEALLATLAAIETQPDAAEALDGFLAAPV